MRRLLTILAVVIGSVASVTGQASASTWGTTTFATVIGPASKTAAQHVSGIGLNGPYQGWHLAIDYTLDPECGQVAVCSIYDFSWEIYSGNDAVWGTCPGHDATEPACPYPAGQTIGGSWDVPLVITGGAYAFDNASGSGQSTGTLVPTHPVTDPAYGELTVTLSPS